MTNSNFVGCSTGIIHQLLAFQDFVDEIGRAPISAGDIAAHPVGVTQKQQSALKIGYTGTPELARRYRSVAQLGG